jgi:hypothetical protein
MQRGEGFIQRFLGGSKGPGQEMSRGCMSITDSSGVCIIMDAMFHGCPWQNKQKGFFAW